VWCWASRCGRPWLSAANETGLGVNRKIKNPTKAHWKGLRSDFTACARRLNIILLLMKTGLGESWRVSERIHIEVLGGFRLSVNGENGPTLPRKSRAMLAYLSVQRDRAASREAVGELLWSDRGADQTRHSLRQALVDLRRHFADDEIIAARDGRLELASDVSCDASVLLALTVNSTPEAMRSAAEAYGGKLLDGFPPISRDFDDWLPPMRARLENTVLDALVRLARAATEKGDAVAALAAIERMFTIDPLREDIHRRLLEACAAAGRRSDALRHYSIIIETLRRELGVTPSRETRELAQRLRREMDPPPNDTAVSVPARPAAGNCPPVAVLPFQQLGNEALPSHLADGLAADIVCQLSGLRELSVISHGSTQGLRDPNLDLRAVGRILGVRYVVRGSLRRSDHSIRMTTELADAGSGTVVWARSHDLSPTISFSDQDRVVAQIVHTLAPRVHEQELRRIRGKRPETLTTYEKVLLARESIGRLERESFLKARTMLDSVMRTEPGYAEAYALAADWHGLLISQGWSPDRQADIKAIDRLSDTALSLDADNVRALIFRAHRKSLHHRAYHEAKEIFAHALEISPNSATGWLWSSYTFAYLNEAEEAVRRATRALQLSPRDRQIQDFYHALCVAHYTAGDYRAATEWGLKALSEKPHRRAAYRWAAASLVAAGRTDQAREIAQRGMLAMPNQTVREVMAVHPYDDEQRRTAYSFHLLAAGFPA
jgi:DNA-binding SARP family transcriptional activator/Tfp pilus assembly protein PilF